MELAAVGVEAHSFPEHLRRFLEPASPVEDGPTGVQEPVPFPLDQLLQLRSRLLDLRQPGQGMPGGIEGIWR